MNGTLRPLNVPRQLQTPQLTEFIGERTWGVDPAESLLRSGAARGQLIKTTPQHGQLRKYFLEALRLRMRLRMLIEGFLVAAD
jgi:hypothetical protein